MTVLYKTKMGQEFESQVLQRKWTANEESKERVNEESLYIQLLVMEPNALEADCPAGVQRYKFSQI